MVSLPLTVSFSLPSSSMQLKHASGAESALHPHGPKASNEARHKHDMVSLDRCLTSVSGFPPMWLSTLRTSHTPTTHTAWQVWPKRAANPVRSATSPAQDQAPSLPYVASSLAITCSEPERTTRIFAETPKSCHFGHTLDDATSKSLNTRYDAHSLTHRLVELHSPKLQPEARPCPH